MGALLFEACAVNVPNFRSCTVPIDGMSACDDFLDSNPAVLNQAQWDAYVASLLAQGQVLECIPSNSIGDIKGAIEKLCSKVTCDYQTQQVIISGLKKIEAQGKQNLPKASD